MYTVGLLRCCGQTRGRNSVHRLAKTASRCRFGAFVYTVAPWAWVVGGLGIAIVYTNGRIGPLRTGLGRLCTLLGCCAVVDRCEDAIVYTDHRKRPLGAVFGAFVYTVASRVTIRIATRSAQGGTSASATMACRRRPLAGPLAWSGRQALREWRRCQVGIFAEASTHTNPRRARYRALSWMVRCC